MKKIIVLIALFAIVAMSCRPRPTYPKYSITTIDYIPDSVKPQYREWIKETVRAASQQMTGGDYEDVDETIYQAERTADRIFGTITTVLNKDVSDSYGDNIYILPKDFTEKEKYIFDSLMNPDKYSKR